MTATQSARKACAALLAAALLIVSLSGCAHKSGTASAATGGATSVGSAKGQSTLAPSSISYPQVAPTSTLEPVSWSGFEPLPSFTYHHVDPKLKNNIAITPATFESELKILKSLGYQTVTARQVVEHQLHGTPLPTKPVMISFDDGWLNQYTYAWPLLKKYGFIATFFINPQPIASKYRAYLTRDDVVALAKAGNDIESHTWRHLRLTRDRNTTAAAFQARSVSELTRANSWIASVTGKAPVALCYPFGYYDLETIGLAKAVGYKAGFTVDEGVADARAWDAWGMKRFTISNLETEASFKRRLLSGPLPVTQIEPAPASRVVGLDATVSVNVTGIPADLVGLKMTGGPSMSQMKVVERDGQRFAEATIHGGKTGFRALSMRATGPDGRSYYASWGIETGDKPQ